MDFAATPEFVSFMQAFTPATDTAVTDHTLRHPYMSPPTHSIRQKASSSSSPPSAPGLPARNTAPLSTGSTPTFASVSISTSASNMDFDTRSRSQARTYTPPSSPTKRSHSKSSSVSSFSIREELENLRRGMSPSSGQPWGEMEKPGSTEPRQFPIWLSDYEMDVDATNAQIVLGTGAWCTVYLASPTPSTPHEMSPFCRHKTSFESSEMTPPPTPVRSRGSSISKFYLPQPSSYAIKVPYERTAHYVLTEEGRALSYLSRFPSAEKYLVPYYGQDPRTDALVMGYMPSTLDSLIMADLNTRDESDRNAMLTDIFPYIACNLLDGLAWIQDKTCVHGDIKPANILINVNPSTRTPHAVYADFSAATIPLSSVASGKTKAPMGGATWDFMAPSQLTSSGSAAPPTPESDVWALAMTLLVFVTGASPYERVAPNAVLKREILKQGMPLEYVSAGENGVRSVLRMGALSRALGFNVKKWLGKVLVRDESKRMDVCEWREELADALM